MSEAPNFSALRSGVEHARFAIHLDDGLAEAHATLSFLLTSRLQFEDARRSAQQAVALEPESWRHQYRLGHALWGAPRLQAFARTLDLYPQFAYARFEMAMVHVARGNFDAASDIVQRGAGDQDRQAQSGDRFPAVGFHWLMGAMRAARGDWEGAIHSFDRELEHADSRRLYGSEYASAALVSRGHASLQLERPGEAAEAFAAALEVLPGHPRALLGLALADARLEKPGACARRAEAAVAELDTPDRQADFLYASACTAAAGNDAAGAASALTRLLDAVPASYVGWAIPIEPVFVGIRSDPAFRAVLTRLAQRAT
jgi:tetratricopeptide (TPR) repeat protein